MTSPEKLATPDSVMLAAQQYGVAMQLSIGAMEAKQALRTEVEALATQRQGEGETQPDKKLWLWKNFVDGRPEYWAFDNPYPCRMDCWEPQTLGEPCGYALFRPSREGRTDWTEEKVLRAIKNARPSRD